MRCGICDFSEETDSILHNSTTDGLAHRDFHERNGEIVCDHCLAAINLAIEDYDLGTELDQAAPLKDAS